MIKTKINIQEVTFNDYQNARVTRSVSDFNSSSDYTIRYDSPFGRHDDDFNVGNEIKIFANQDAEPTTNIFTGIVETIKFIGKGAQQKVELRGRDFSARLQDATVLPVVFTDSEVSTIVTNIIQNNVPQDITTNNVNVTGTTLARIVFNHESVFDALTQLANLAGFHFYVDEDKDLHFEQKENLSSGIILDNTNIIDMVSNTTREGMANSIWVYGDRQLTGITEVLTNNGSPWGGAVGSEFLLTYKPHNTETNLLGSTLIGGILNMVVSPTSGIDYLINFEDRQIIFVSGTDLGKFDKNTVNSEKVIKFKLDKKILDITDQITDIRKRIDAIESQDRQESDVITRLIQGTGSFQPIGSSWFVLTAEQTGSTMYLSSPARVFLINSTLASGTLQGQLAGEPLGSSFTPLTIQAQGGFDY